MKWERHIPWVGQGQVSSRRVTSMDAHVLTSTSRICSVFQKWRLVERSIGWCREGDIAAPGQAQRLISRDEDDVKVGRSGKVVGTARGGLGQTEAWVVLRLLDAVD